MLDAVVSEAIQHKEAKPEKPDAGRDRQNAESTLPKDEQLLEHAPGALLPNRQVLRPELPEQSDKETGVTGAEAVQTHGMCFCAFMLKPYREAASVGLLEASGYIHVLLEYCEGRQGLKRA